MSTRQIKRGQIVYADISQCVGSEQGGIRPCLVIQNDKGNQFSPTTIICCLTSKAYSKPNLPTHYIVNPTRENGLEKISVVLCEQLRTIDKTRILSVIGNITKEQEKEVDKRICASLGMNIGA